MKIKNVEIIYLRQPQLKQQADSGQDATMVRLFTDAAITGIGEADSAPLAVKGRIEGPFSHSLSAGLRELLIGEKPLHPDDYAGIESLPPQPTCALRLMRKRAAGTRF